MNQEILDLSTLYVTNRSQFEIDHGNSRDAVWLHMLFNEASTRPDLAETIAVSMCGFTPSDKKHDVDGFPSPTRIGEYAEAKVTTTNSTNTRGGIGNITINDPSSTIITKYSNLKPLFIFPLYVDGYMLACFSTPWEIIQPFYDNGIAAIYEKNKIKKSGESAARNFSLSANNWIDDATLEFVYPDQTLTKKLVTGIGVTKKYRARVLDELS